MRPAIITTLVLFTAAAGCTAPASRDEDPDTGAPGDDATGTMSQTADTATTDGAGDGRFDVGEGGTGGGGDGEMTPCELAKTAVSNQGCEFWAVDLPNTDAPQPGVPAPSAQQFAVVVANGSEDHDAAVSIFRGAETIPIDTVTVESDGTRQISLPAQSIDPTASTADGVAYRIESDHPITAYQFNPLDNTVKVYSNDATILFPSHVLGLDYAAVTEDATSKGATYISVVALEDGTNVEVFPTAQLAIAGPPEATIDRGEVFTVVSTLDDGMTPNGGNLSGSRIAADAPVAVFSGNVSAPITTPDRICCADHLEHQMMPLDRWGSAYLAAAPPAGVGSGSDPAQYRITGAFDGTRLVYDPAPPPGAPTTISAYESVSFLTDASFSVRAEDADTPFSVTQFLVSGFLTTLPDLNLRVGDPSMIVLVPLRQQRDDYLFVVPMAYARNFVTIAAPMSAQIEIDGLELPPGSLTPIGAIDGEDYGHADVELEAGPHRVNGSAPLQVVSVGYDTDVSYGFAAGSGFEIIGEPPPPPEG